MGGLSVAERSSLERLKDLEALPDVASQLAEARRLCIHAVRADMIAHWLLEKLKSAKEYQTSSEAWEILLFTFRLLSQEQLATLLISHDLFATLDSTLKDTRASEDLLEAITDVVVFLFELSSTSTETPIQAILRLPAARAASLFGHWLHNISRIASARSLAPTGYSAIFDPAFQIWDSRATSSDDSSFFAKQCLVPAASLLSQFARWEQEPSLKRKRRSYDEDKDHHHDPKSRLEKLLARHIFLPARVAFFKASDSVGGQARQLVESSQQGFAISPAVSPLKTTIDSDIEEKHIYLAALPLLLDVALRYAPATTPRQRTKERPWVETLFQALYDCNKDGSEQVMSSRALIDMLKVIGHRASVSEQLLENIVRSHTRLVKGVESANTITAVTDIEWSLIAQVVHLDAELFCQPELSENLFKTLTEATVRQSRGDADPQSGLTPTITPQTMRELWVDRIVAPIMNAFARSRNLGAFVSLWLEQLRRDRHDQLWSIWTEIDVGFRVVLEDSMTENEIVNLIDRLSGHITALRPDVEASGASSLDSDFGPSAVVLNAILGGLRSEKLLAAISPRCEKIFEDLMRGFETSSSVKQEIATSMNRQSRVWCLMGETFSIWFPVWTATQTDPSPIARKADAWISSPAIDAALALGRTAILGNSASPIQLRMCHEAQYFVANICSVLLNYKRSMNEESQSILQERVGDLAKQLDPANLQPLLQDSALFSFIESTQTRKAFLERCISAASTTYGAEAVSNHVLEGLRALATSVAMHKQTVAIEDIVSIATEVLRSRPQHHPDRKDEETAQKQSVVLHMLSIIPAECLTRNQRERILDALSPEKNVQAPPSDESLQKRLVLMIHLMEKPNATAKLSTDPTMIWRVGIGASVSRCVVHDIDFARQVPSAETIALLAELAKFTLKHLLSAQEQERSRSVLIDLSRDAKAMVTYLTESAQVRQNLAALTISMSIISELESGSKPSLASQLPHRDAAAPVTISDFLMRLCNDCMLLAITEPTPSDNAQEPLEYETVLNALEGVVEVLEKREKGDGHEVHPDLTSDASEVNSFLSSNDLSSLSITARFPRYYAVLSRYAPSLKMPLLTRLCLLVLDKECPPEQLRALLNSYSEYIERIDAASRIALLNELLSKDESSVHSKLLLLECCIAKLDKEDFTQTESSPAYHLIPTLLQIATQTLTLLARQRATRCIITVLKDKPFLNNQHTIEVTLANLPKLLEVRVGLATAFTDICRIVSALLLTHRPRLHGRFQQLAKVFMDLITALFQNQTLEPPTNPPSSKSRKFNKALTSTHAHALSRLLVLFCEPLNPRPHSTSNTSSAGGLVDESRKEQAYVGRHAQILLHHFCAQILSGSNTGEDGVREALTPGIWAVIEAVEAGTEDGVKVLSAAMGNSERAVLRGVWDEWKRFGKWRGG